ncbi:MAG TPA: WD40 repeat domain-containing protein, partial [Ktedonobacteraceae bacterium]|nr:WD40 repeat domain-containing protein [Ktedonobacteraceae bacterium]
VPNEQQEMAIVRRWDLTARTRTGKPRPQIATSVLVGRCADCTPPYALTPDANTIAFVHAGRKIRLCETATGTYSELSSGTMGSSSRLALSPDAQWAAVAREDSEVNEGVIDLWSVSTGQIVQKFYHPWQISALHFTDKQLVVALTDGTIQLWE